MRVYELIEELKKQNQGIEVEVLVEEANEAKPTTFSELVNIAKQCSVSKEELKAALKALVDR